MTCCSLTREHTHYPAWLRGTSIEEHCECGQHPRRWSVGALMAVWSRRPRQTRH